MSSFKTHYDNLKVTRNAPDEVIRAAYRSLSQKYHPDRNPGDEEAARIMSLINVAYEVLSNPSKRREHDEWIARRELDNQPRPEATRRARSDTEAQQRRPVDVSGIRSRRFDFSRSPPQIKEKISERARNKAMPQFEARTDNVLPVYGMAVFALFVLAVVYTQKAHPAWTKEGLWAAIALAALGAACLARAIVLIAQWHLSVAGSRLLVTPLYVIRVEPTYVKFWPLWELGGISATENRKNGSYQNTSVLIHLGGKAEKFTLFRENEYGVLVRALQDFSLALKFAVERGDEGYVKAQDDLLGTESWPDGEARRFGLTRLNLLAVGASGVAGVGALLLSWPESRMWLNLPVTPSNPLAQSSPYKRAYPVVQPSPQPRAWTPVPNEVLRPHSTPDGKRWPTTSGYVSGYSLEATGGLSSIMVDNSANSSDVLVKLFDISSNPRAVRTFFIRAGDAFRVDKVRAGNYDVRYKDLDTGDLVKSEPLRLEQIRTSTGTQYSEVRLTLYSVANGNMATFPITEADF